MLCGCSYESIINGLKQYKSRHVPAHERNDDERVAVRLGVFFHRVNHVLALSRSEIRFSQLGCLNVHEFFAEVIGLKNSECRSTLLLCRMGAMTTNTTYHHIFSRHHELLEPYPAESGSVGTCGGDQLEEPFQKFMKLLVLVLFMGELHPLVQDGKYCRFLGHL